jgi:hypothetical protein
MVLVGDAVYRFDSVRRGKEIMTTKADQEGRSSIRGALLAREQERRKNEY